MWKRGQFLSFIAIFAVFLFAFPITSWEQLEQEVSKIEKENIQRKYKGATVPRTSPGTAISDKQKVKVIKITRYEISDKELKVPQFDVVFGENLKKDKERNKSVNTAPQQIFQQTQQRKIIARAYCFTRRNIKITLEEVYETLDCLVLSGLNKRFTTAEAVFTPNPREFSLNAKIIYFDSKKVKKSFVIDANTKRKNVADRVNKRLLAKILLKTASKTGRQVASVVENIMSSATKITVGNNYSVAVQDIDKQFNRMPKAILYMSLANLASSTSEEVFRSNVNLPPIFEVKKGKELFVEVEF